MSVMDTLNTQIKESMKNKDKTRLSVLRMMKSKIMQVDTKGNMDDAAATKLINSYAKNLKETIDQCEKLGKTEMSEESKAELVIVSEFLPKTLSYDETLELVKGFIAELEIKTKKDIGKIMKAVFGSGKAVEGALVKKAVDELIQE
ncbi:MAG: hypothetical protein COA79_05825 [Planctomycetota bacterium]|nr:MAG: hypothetical protein COA79_05825 [Planctomycetota bacterium]